MEVLEQINILIDNYVDDVTNLTNLTNKSMDDYLLDNKYDIINCI